MRCALLCAHIIGCAPATSPPIEVSLPAQHAASASPEASSTAAARLPAWPTCARTVADKDWQTKAASTERCYFGILALGYLRDGYLRGLDGKSPGPALPTLPSAGRAPKGPLLPNMRLLQACPVAAAQNPDTAAMTEALVKANELREVAKLFNEAAAYYAEGEQEADGFAHGRELHAKLLPELRAIDAAAANVLGALTSFCSEKPPSARGGTAGLGHSVAQASIDAVLASHYGLPEQERRASVARLRAALDALAATATSDDRDPYFVLLVTPARALADALAVIDQRTEARIAVVTKLERVLQASYRAGVREEAAKRQ